MSVTIRATQHNIPGDSILHKSMLFSFFDIEAIVHKEFVLAGQTVPHTTMAFYGKCVNTSWGLASNFGKRKENRLLHCDDGPCLTRDYLMKNNMNVVPYQGMVLQLGY
jgi:hypothetical protein